jgi:cytochrome P450
MHSSSSLPHSDQETPTIRPLSSLPGPAPALILGNMLQIKTSIFHKQLEGWAEEFGNYYRLRLGRQDALVLSDPAAAAKLMRDRPESVTRANRIATALNEAGGTGVFTAEGEHWRAQRKLVMRSLTPEVIRNFFPRLVEITERLQRRWTHAVMTGQKIDFLHDLGAFSLDAIVRLSMGHDINTIEGGENQLQRDIEFIFQRVAKRVTSPIPYWRYVRLPVDREMDAASKRIETALYGFIDRARAQMAENPELRERPANLLQALIVARDEPDSGFTDHDVVGNAFTMVFAGEDTTSHSLAWLIYHLACSGDAERQMQQETAQVMGQDRVLCQYGQLDAFPYLDGAINESMRLTPVAPVMTLEPTADMVIGDIQVSASTPVILLLRQVSKQGDFGTEQQAFRPDRWLSTPSCPVRGDLSRQMFPFGGGARFCPGRYLAMVEIRMVMTMLAQNFNLQLDRAAPPVNDLFVYTMNPDAMPIGLTMRSSN